MNPNPMHPFFHSLPRYLLLLLAILALVAVWAGLTLLLVWLGVKKTDAGEVVTILVLLLGAGWAGVEMWRGRK